MQERANSSPCECGWPKRAVENEWFPQATPNDVVAALKQQGITASPGLASNIKYTSGRRSGTKRRGRPPGRGRTAGANGALTAADLIEAKRLAEQLGGIEQARQALATLEELR